MRRVFRTPLVACPSRAALRIQVPEQPSDRGFPRHDRAEAGGVRGLRSGPAPDRPASGRGPLQGLGLLLDRLRPRWPQGEGHRLERLVELRRQVELGELQLVERLRVERDEEQAEELGLLTVGAPSPRGRQRASVTALSDRSAVPGARPGQSRSSTTTGIRRGAAFCSYSAKFANVSFCVPQIRWRSSSPATRAVALRVSVPISTVTSGFATRL